MVNKCVIDSKDDCIDCKDCFWLGLRFNRDVDLNDGFNDDNPNFHRQ